MLSWPTFPNDDSPPVRQCYRDHKLTRDALENFLPGYHCDIVPSSWQIYNHYCQPRPLSKSSSILTSGPTYTHHIHCWVCRFTYSDYIYPAIPSPLSTPSISYNFAAAGNDVIRIYWSTGHNDVRPGQYHLDMDRRSRCAFRPRRHPFCSTCNGCSDTQEAGHGVHAARI